MMGNKEGEYENLVEQNGMCMHPARYLGCATGVVPWPWLLSERSKGWDSHMQ